MSKELTQTFTSAEGWYTLEYPRIWVEEIVENIPSFFDPYFGQGALQMFSVKTGESVIEPEIMEQYPFLSGKTLIDKMKIFLTVQSVNVENLNFKVYNQGGMDYLPFEYRHDGRFYMSVFMEKNNILLLALYNSQDNPTAEEALIIGNIIKSVKILT